MNKSTIIFMFKDSEAVWEYFERVKNLKEDTEENRLNILVDMSAEGFMQQVSETTRTREEIVADYAKNFGNVLDFRYKREGD